MLEQELLLWTGDIVSFHLPRWDELPEIDLYMDQVIVFSERIFSRFPGIYSSKLISPSIINNYVKLGIIPQPVKKKYSRTHITYLMMICILKQVLPISAITDLIAYQLQTDSIPLVYNRFCEVQEQATKAAVETAQKEYFLKDTTDDTGPRAASVELALRMAATANSSKIVAEKIICLKRERELALTVPSEVESEDKRAKTR
ncbi:MAG: DUF1836 domain-containing protein [Acetanaerobacterium sp.]